MNSFIIKNTFGKMCFTGFVLFEVLFLSLVLLFSLVS